MTSSSTTLYHQGVFFHREGDVGPWARATASELIAWDDVSDEADDMRFLGDEVTSPPEEADSAFGASEDAILDYLSSEECSLLGEDPVAKLKSLVDEWIVDRFQESVSAA